MPRQSPANEWVTSNRRVLLSFDWKTRHQVWARLSAYMSRTADRRKLLDKLRASLSSADLLDGEHDCLKIPDYVVIALPAPPRKGVQLKITDFFRKLPKKKTTRHQLLITHFFKMC